MNREKFVKLTGCVMWDMASVNPSWNCWWSMGKGLCNSPWKYTNIQTSCIVYNLLSRSQSLFFKCTTEHCQSRLESPEPGPQKKTIEAARHHLDRELNKRQLTSKEECPSRSLEEKAFLTEFRLHYRKKILIPNITFQAH